MKFLAVLLGLVCLACSQEEDIEPTRDQVMNTLTTELIRRGLNAEQAAANANAIVQNEENWEFLMEERIGLGSGFLSETHMDDMFEMFLPRDVLESLQDESLAQIPEINDDD